MLVLIEENHNYRHHKILKLIILHFIIILLLHRNAFAKCILHSQITICLYVYVRSTSIHTFQIEKKRGY